MKRWIHWGRLNTFRNKLGFVTRPCEVWFHAKKVVIGRIDFFGEEKGFVATCGKHIWEFKGYHNIKIRELTQEEKVVYERECGSSYVIEYPRHLQKKQLQWIDKDFVEPNAITAKQIVEWDSKSSIVCIDIYCPVKKESFKIDYNDIDWEFSSDPCETYGSHGYLNAAVKCQCGITHTIEIRSW